MTLHFAFLGVFLLLFMLLLIISDSFVLLSLHFIPAVISISVLILSLVWIYFSLLLCVWVILPYSLFCYLISLSLRILLPRISLWSQERERNICQLQTQEIYSALYLFFFLIFQGFDLRDSCQLLHEILISSADTALHRNCSILVSGKSVKDYILCVYSLLESIFHHWEFRIIKFLFITQLNISLPSLCFWEVRSVNNFFIFIPLLYNWCIVII